jgi:hypothetical protein
MLAQKSVEWRHLLFLLHVPDKGQQLQCVSTTGIIFNRDLAASSCINHSESHMQIQGILPWRGLAPDAPQRCLRKLHRT